MAAFGMDRDTVTLQDLRPRSANCNGSNSTPTPIACKRSNWSTAPSAIRPGAPVGRILLASDGKTLLERELRPGRLVIGRTADNDIQIDSKFISRHHCQIVTQGDSCLIEDLNSTNGISCSRNAFGGII